MVSVDSELPRVEVWTPEAVTYTALSAMACITATPIAIVQIQGRNLALSVLMTLTGLLNVFNATNAIIWTGAGDASQWWKGTGLCDVEVRLYRAGNQAMIGAAASSFRRLAHVLDDKQLSIAPSRTAVFQQRIFEVGFCLGLPLILSGVSLLAQSLRYRLYPVTGCAVTDTFSLPVSLPIRICEVGTILVALYFTILTIYRLVLYRRNLSSIMRNTLSISRNRLSRVFVLSSIMACNATIMTCISLATALSSHARLDSPVLLFAQPNWSERIQIVLSPSIPFDRWMQIGSGLLMFALFGFEAEALAIYRSVYRRLGLARLIESIRTKPPSISAQPRIR